MESNQELMILSLLNLYTSYVNLKRYGTGNTNKKSFCNRYVTKHQTCKTPNKERQINNNGDGLEKSSNCIYRNVNEGGLVSHNASIADPKTSTSIIDVVPNEKVKAFHDCNTDVTGGRLEAGSPTNPTIIVDIVDDSVMDKEKPKNVKRRRRGKKNAEEDAEKIKIRKQRIRRWQIRPVNRDRALTGFYRKVFSNIKKMDQQQFFEHTRMTKSLFDWLLSFVHSSIRKKKQSILAEERLAITLNYLAFGTSLQSIAWKHKVGKSTVRQIVLDTCGALWTLLSPIYLSEPTTSQYADIAEDFNCKFNIPNCVGTIDGKLVSIRDPSKSAPVNNKAGLSIPILGICDTNYKFLAVSVGNFNNQSDNGIFQLSTQNNIIISDNLPLPSSKPLAPSSLPFPYYFITDTSFPLQRNIMRSYAETDLDAAKTIFNCQMSRAQQIAENTFGILSARFRVLLTTIEYLPDNCKIIILACIALHNFIMTNDEENLYCPANFIDRQSDTGIIIEGKWREELKNNGNQPLLSMTSNESRSTFEANNLRNLLTNYFASESVSYEIQIIEQN